MDAKPQRATMRNIRVNDENTLPTNVAAQFGGKTLHQRTKSTSALGAAAALQNKKVLAETNANIRLAPKDDSEIGKASPGKIKISQDSGMPVQVAPFNRPAVRPLGAKNGFSQNTAYPQAPVPVASVDQAKKIIPKKSKVLRDILPAVQPEIAKDTSNAVLPQADQAQQPVQAPRQSAAVVVVPHQEVHHVETVPLRDEPASRAIPVVGHQRKEVQPFVLSQTNYQPVQPEVQPIPNGTLLDASQQYPVVTPPAQQDQLDEDFDDGDQDYLTAHSFDLRSEPTETTIFNPNHSKKQKQEIEEARIWVEQNRTPDEVEDEAWDTSMVAEYGDEIFEYMRDMESRMSPNPYYMETQTEVQWSMRGVLMDWVVQVHQRFNLLPETLFLTVNYIDRFLSCKVVSLGKLQLVGATAIFVAAKYEEVNCPTISEIIYMVDNGYTADELLKAERFMLSMLQFELGWPGPMSFLRRISKADDYDLETRTLAKYFLEVTIMDERFVGCKPSFLAAGAHCMARLMLRKGDWTKAHVFYSNYTFRQLHQLLSAIFVCCLDAPKHHCAVFDKYTDKRYKRASTFVQAEMAKGFQLPFTHRASSLGALGPATNWLQQ